MISQSLKLIESFFRSLSKTLFRCQICAQDGDVNPNELLFEQQLNNHLLSYNHLMIIKESFVQDLNLLNQQNYDSDIEKLEKQILFKFSIAQELNQEGLYLYFQNCLSNMQLYFLKRKQHRKNILLFQKGSNYFYFMKNKISFQTKLLFNFQKKKNINITPFQQSIFLQKQKAIKQVIIQEEQFKQKKLNNNNQMKVKLKNSCFNVNIQRYYYFKTIKSELLYLCCYFLNLIYNLSAFLQQSFKIFYKTKSKQIDKEDQLKQANLQNKQLQSLQIYCRLRKFNLYHHPSKKQETYKVFWNSQKNN